MHCMLMLFVHKDIKVNVDKVLDLFVAKKSRRMVLPNPLAITLVLFHSVSLFSVRSHSSH